MGVLVRKINKGKWLQNDICAGDDVSADAITSCMRTSNNTLSTWFISEESELNRAILAIVSGHQHLDTIDVVCLSQSQLEGDGLSIEETKGETPIEELEDTHRDIVNINYSTLGNIANQIKSEIQSNKVRRYTKGKLKKILTEAINSGELTIEKLKPSIAEKL